MQADASPVTAGVTITVEDVAHHQLPDAMIFVYRYGSDITHPVLVGSLRPTSGSGTLPLPTPTTDPANPDNYFAIYAAPSPSGDGGLTGIWFFTLSPETPTAGIQAIARVNTSSCVVIPPPPGYPKNTFSGPDTIEDNVHVGDANGAGSTSVSNTAPGDLLSSPDVALGEVFSSKWTRNTASDVMVKVGGTAGNAYVQGEARFALLEAGDASWYIAGGGTTMAGYGARAVIAPADWQEEELDYWWGPNCLASSQITATPWKWVPERGTTFPSVDASSNTYSAFQACNCASTRVPVHSGGFVIAGGGVAETYGTDTALGVNPIFNVNWHSATTYDTVTETDIYPGAGCGVAITQCFYYVKKYDSNQSCPQTVLCDGDIYTFTVQDAITGQVPGFCAPGTAAVVDAASQPICA